MDMQGSLFLMRTTALELYEFVKNVFSEQTETIVQLKRCCSIKIHVQLSCSVFGM